jgi:hypothetical protein
MNYIISNESQPAGKILKITGKFIIAAFFLLSVSLTANSQIAKDKQLHLGAGAVVGSWGYLLPSQSTGWKPVAYGIGTATIAGVGKELSDLGGFGTPDWKDLGATVIGGVVSVGIITGFRAIFRHHGNNTKRQMLFARK